MSHILMRTCLLPKKLYERENEVHMTLFQNWRIRQTTQVDARGKVCIYSDAVLGMCAVQSACIHN